MDTGFNAISTFEKLRKIVSEQLGVPESSIQLESHIIDDLGGDSLDAMELIMSVEHEFAIEIDDYEGQYLFIVQEIVQKIDEKLNEKLAVTATQKKNKVWDKEYESPSIWIEGLFNLFIRWIYINTN